MKEELKLAKNMTDKAEKGNKRNQEKKKRKGRKQRTKIPRKTRRNKKWMRFGKRSHQILTIIKKRWSTRSLTIGASNTWLRLLINWGTVGLAMTKVNT